MPANRSRTDRWRQSLDNIQRRGGGLEFAIDRGEHSSPEDSDLVWRVKVHQIDGDVIVLEHPGAMGHSFEIEQGTPLIGIMSVGQNKWMFKTKVVSVDSRGRRVGDRVLIVKMPEGVERCMRRQFDRTSLAQITLPKVNMWPLLDPSSAAPFEIASRMLVDKLREEGRTADTSGDPQMLPSVGPMCEAQLANLGGGGVGLVIDHTNRSSLENATLWWLSIDLRPSIPAPLTMVARMAHTHTDSQQNIYAGLAFEFGTSGDHKRFVLGEIERYLFDAQRGAKRAA